MQEAQSSKPEVQVFVIADKTERYEVCGIASDSDNPDEKEEEVKATSNSIVELKELPVHLKYSYLEKENIHPVIISAALDSKQEESLLSILKLYKNVIGYSIDDIKGIDEKVCSHRIHLKENSTPSREGQRRLTPTMQEVVKRKS